MFWGVVEELRSVLGSGGGVKKCFGVCRFVWVFFCVLWGVCKFVGGFVGLCGGFVGLCGGFVDLYRGFVDL